VGLVEQLNYRVLQESGTGGTVKLSGASEESDWWNS
jgi:hypothetical protein